MGWVVIMLQAHVWEPLMDIELQTHSQPILQVTIMILNPILDAHIPSLYRHASLNVY